MWNLTKQSETRQNTTYTMPEIQRMDWCLLGVGDMGEGGQKVKNFQL